MPAASASSSASEAPAGNRRDRDQQRAGGAGADEQHRRLAATIDELAEQRAADAQRDRVDAADEAGGRERAGQMLGVHEQPDAEHRQRQPREQRDREQLAGAGVGGDRVHALDGYVALVHRPDPVSGHGRDQSADRAAAVGRPGRSAHARRADRGSVPPARSARERCARAHGCPRPATWRASSASRGASRSTPTRSSRPRATSRSARARAHGSPRPQRSPRRRPRRSCSHRAALRYDFRPSVPDVSTFPRTAWLRSLREAVDDDHRRRPRLRGPARRRPSCARSWRTTSAASAASSPTRARGGHERLLAGTGAGLPRARGQRRAADRGGGPERTPRSG